MLATFMELATSGCMGASTKIFFSNCIMLTGLVDQELAWAGLISQRGTAIGSNPTDRKLKY